MRSATAAAGYITGGAALRDVATANKAMAGYLQAGNLAAAEALFEEILPHADVVSWNTILSGRRRAGDPVGALRHFLRMRREGLRPTARTMVVAIAAAADVGDASTVVPQLHAAALHTAALISGPFAGTALVAGYAKTENPAAARQMFNEMPIKNSAAWTALIGGMMEAGRPGEARRAFAGMPVKTVPAWTAIVAGHIRNGDPSEARRCFDAMPARTVVSWTALIKGYIRAGMFAHAFNLFVEMRSSPGASPPNAFTFSAVLGACAGASSLRAGESVHADLSKSGVPPDAVLVSSLVDMYSKCGDGGAAVRAFEQLGGFSLESWNAVISCCARHGLGARAVEELARMAAAGVAPDGVTFVSVLAACARGGMVEEAAAAFGAMAAEFGVKAEVAHYGCMVDVLGRVGEVEAALRVAEEMAAEKDAAVVAALAWSCGEWGRGMEEVGEAAEVVGMGKHPAVLLAMKRARAERGDWGAVAELRRRLPSAPHLLQRAFSRIPS